MNFKSLIRPILLICLFVAGCATKSEPMPEPMMVPEPDSVITNDSGYPITTIELEPQSGYPIIQTPDYVRDYTEGPKFTITTPVSAQDQWVYGVGPADVPIKLINVSEVGIVLSETTIAGDGTFTFKLDEPLVPGHVIGIQLGDLTNTDFNEEDFLYNETYYDRPFVGLMFDMVTVE